MCAAMLLLAGCTQEPVRQEPLELSDMIGKQTEYVKQSFAPDDVIVFYDVSWTLLKKEPVFGTVDEETSIVVAACESTDDTFTFAVVPEVEGKKLLKDASKDQYNYLLSCS